MQLKIDEFTLSFLHKQDKLDNQEHIERSEYFIDYLYEELKLNEFGLLQPYKAINGYNVTYKVENTSKLTLGYHSDWPEMGLSVVFGARDLSEYLAALTELSGASLDALELIKWLNILADENGFKIRLSRLDIAADFVDYGFSVDELYNEIKSEVYYVTDWKESRKKKLGQFFGSESEIESFYIGKYTTRTGFLRVYDKKVEQLKRKGYQLEIASKCSDWVRVEAVYRDNYAHEATKTLLEAEDHESTLANFITSRYRFKSEKGYHLITQELLEAKPSGALAFSKNYRQYSLDKSKQALYSGQVQNTLYKIRKIEGEEAAKVYLVTLLKYNLSCYEPSKEVKVFVNKFKKSNQKTNNDRKSSVS